MITTIVSLWLPLALFLGSIIIEQLIEPQTGAWLVGEGGPYELLQFGLMCIGFWMAIYILVRMDRTNRWLMAWIGLAALGCLYVAGDEVSWGQHFLKWESSDFWSGVNDQNETNLHNISSWLDQKPRILLIIGVYVGGLVIPLLMKFRPSLLPDRFTIIYPNQKFITTAVLCLALKVYDSLGDITGVNLLYRSAETEEIFIYYFVVLYLLLMMKRLTMQPRKPG